MRPRPFARCASLPHVVLLVSLSLSLFLSLSLSSPSVSTCVRPCVYISPSLPLLRGLGFVVFLSSLSLSLLCRVVLSYLGLRRTLGPRVSLVSLCYLCPAVSLVFISSGRRSSVVVASTPARGGLCILDIVGRIPQVAGTWVPLADSRGSEGTCAPAISPREMHPAPHS